MKKAVIALGILISADVMSAEIVGMGLTSMYNYSENLPKYATSYNGERTDVSEFYKEDIPFSLYASGYVVLSTNTRIDLGIDSGFSAQKMSREPRLDVTLRQNYDFSKVDTVSFTASQSFFGKEKHTPCLDSFEREYYCGNLTAWTDFKQPDNDHKWSTSITFIHRF